MVNQVLTDIEQKVYNWLTQRKVEFQYSTSLSGGIFEMGGAVVDFVLPSLRIAIRVMGSYWHSSPESTAHDDIQREILVGQGWTVIDLWDNDLLDPNRLNQAMNLALQGQEMLR